MKSLIKCVVIVCVIVFYFVSGNTSEIKVNYSSYPNTPSICDSKGYGEKSEGSSCKEPCDCGKDLICTEGYCTPYVKQRQVSKEYRNLHWYRIAHGGPYNDDYILNVQYTCIDDSLFIWVDEKEYKIRTYNPKNDPRIASKTFSVMVPKDSFFRIQLYDIHNELKGKSDDADFVGKVYLTKVAAQEKKQ